MYSKFVEFYIDIFQEYFLIKLYEKVQTEDYASKNNEIKISNLILYI